MVYEFTATDDTAYFFGLHLVSSDDYRYVLNAHGDVIALVSKTGSTISKYYEYDAFGNEINPDSSDTNPYRYCGEYYDFESGTIYLRARYYSPTHGRFTQPDRHWNTGNMIYGDADNTNADSEQAAKLLVPDILAIRQSSNLYVYCGNNAPNYCDISGESFAALGVLGLIVIGALTGCGMDTHPMYQSNASISPGLGWEWRGRGTPESCLGAWYNPETGESMHPDFYHGGDIGPHWDYTDKDGVCWRIFPDNHMELKED